MSRRLATLIFILLIFMAFREAKIYQLEYPNYFPKPEYNFRNNPLDSSKVELGRLLFFDPILSKDNSISCASCHSPYNAFAHTDHDLSHGIYDQIGTRNAPALFNLAWQKTFMWDGAINHLDMQALAPISDSTEMGETIVHVIEKLSQKKLYKESFFLTYQDSIITGEKLLKALSQFQLSLVSSNSKYDRVRKQETEFTKQETKGYHLFQQHCNSCHAEPLFSNYQFSKNELPLDSGLNDFGRFKVTQQEEDRFKFKVPTLRNLSFTFPYMHDGRFKKLNKVLNHYTSESIKAQFKKDPKKKVIELSEDEKVDLISFLLTLNDKSFVFNSKHQFPKVLLEEMKGIK
ncbi:MAG: c-type cytochrome [Flavobacteriales bacterium]|nr:c-type cytochrome [Flavobacteriales bacterium]